MTDSLLFFTFSPIQTFIQEARRAEDLFNGSAILSDLAKAAAQSIKDQGGSLIYPAGEVDGKFLSDVPNVLVAEFKQDEKENVGKKVKESIQKEFEARWQAICDQALMKMRGLGIPIDKTWEDIWEQQVKPDHLWEIYWAVVPLGNGYADAYRQASRAIGGLKRSRIFKQPMEEKGQKDSLSGKRAALHTANFTKAKDYWADVSKLSDVYPSKVRPNGRERLDAISAVKRFAELKNEPFDSTSTVAAADYIERAKGFLHTYRDLLGSLFDEEKEVFRPYKKVTSKADWPYDGDLLYDTTLTVERFKSDYHFHFDDKDPQAKQDEEALANELKECRDLLKGNKEKKIKGIYEEFGKPSPYYALIVLDGDSMGAKIDGLLDSKTQKPDEAHKEFSQRLGLFSAQVKKIVVDEHHGFLVYNGGDDVMCMAPLSKAVPLAIALREAFKETMKDFNVSVSAGVAISHHQSPLDFAIEEARKAEKAAKKIDKQKNAICIHVMKRSGEPLEVRSGWDDMNTIVEELRGLFAENTLSSRLAYVVQHDAPVLTGLVPEARRSMLKVLLKRQSADGFDAETWANRLGEWARKMDALEGVRDGFTEMANWLVLARFLSQSGGEQ